MGCQGDGSSVKIAGDVTCSAYGAFGALARDGGSIEIDGDVSTSGDYCSGVNAVGSGSTVSIGGDVTVFGTEATGVCASGGGLAVIDGVLTAPVAAYIVLVINPAEGDPVRVVKGTDGGVPAIGDYEGYLLYSDGVNFVYVRIQAADTTPPAINPASARYDLNAPAGILTNITWNSAESSNGRGTWLKRTASGYGLHYKRQRPDHQ